MPSCWQLVVVVQSVSCVRPFVTPMDCSTPGFLSFIISQKLLKLTSTALVMPSNHLILCRRLLLPSIFPNIRVFSSEFSLHIRWPKYWSFSFSISPSDEYSELISFRIQWFDLAVQGTLRSLLDMITALKSAYIIPMPVCIPSPMCICLWTARSSLCCFTYILYLEYT